MTDSPNRMAQEAGVFPPCANHAIDGKPDEDCIACNMLATRLEAADPRRSESQFEPCTECSGFGRIGYNGTCEACDGTGRVRKSQLSEVRFCRWCQHSERLHDVGVCRREFCTCSGFIAQPHSESPFDARVKELSDTLREAVRHIECTRIGASGTVVLERCYATLRNHGV